MKERPILFSAPMVRAILDGRKTMTRRRIGKPVCKLYKGWPQYWAGPCDCQPIRCPYGQPGDRLWVRETHKGWYTYQSQQYVCYASDNSTHIVRRPEGHPEGGMLLGECHADKWRPAIHMPRWASRITLEVTGVRAQRLHEITEADAVAEGVQWPYYEEFEPVTVGGLTSGPARIAFKDLWEGINGRGSWEANPWVWVVEFRRV